LPETGAPPCVVKVKVVAGVLIVAEFIASVKVAVIAVLIGTPVALFSGNVKVTAGTVVGWLDDDDHFPPHPVIKKALRIKINKR